MKQATINLYSFDELSSKVQEKVLNDNRYIHVEDSWWIYLYDDAKQIYLYIDEFDIDRNYIKGQIEYELTGCAKLILENHGEETETYVLAKNYLEGIENNFEQKLLKAYLNLLSKEYDYLISDEAIKETINANEYTFLEDGTMFNV